MISSSVRHDSMLLSPAPRLPPSHRPPPRQFEERRTPSASCSQDRAECRVRGPRTGAPPVTRPLSPRSQSSRVSASPANRVRPPSSLAFPLRRPNDSPARVATSCSTYAALHMWSPPEAASAPSPSALTPTARVWVNGQPLIYSEH